MKSADPIVTSLPADQLGGPGAPDSQACSANAMRLLGEAAGPGMRLSSLSLDVTSHPLGAGQVDVAVRIDKRARSIVFASIEARSADRLVYAAQGLFSRTA